MTTENFEDDENNSAKRIIKEGDLFGWNFVSKQLLRDNKDKINEDDKE